MNASSGSAQLLIGPLNTASQASSWADAVSVHAGLSSKSFAQDGYFSRRLRGMGPIDPAHASVPHKNISVKVYRTGRINRLFTGVTHYLNESNFPLFGDPTTSSFEIEIPRFAEQCVSLAVVFHGSDIRDPVKHALENEHSYFRGAPPEWSAVLARKASRNRLAAEQMGLPVFVSTPDLLNDVPFATLLPLVVDLDYWEAGPAPFVRPRPRVLHLPSQSRIKGTDFIEPVLSDLDREGAIEWIRSAAVPRSGMRRLVRTADIVIDQIQTGSYGVAAVEAMSCGRLVIGNVSSFVTTFLGEEVPIVNATPTTLRTAIMAVLGDRGWAKQQAALGRPFVRKWHSGAASAQALASFLAKPPS